MFNIGKIEVCISWQKVADSKCVLFYREIEHPNVLKLLGQCVETSPYLVVLELCPFVSIHTHKRITIDLFVL